MPKVVKPAGKLSLFLGDYVHRPFSDTAPVPIRTYWTTAPPSNGPAIEVSPLLIEVAQGQPLDIEFHNECSGGRPIIDVYEHGGGGSFGRWDAPWRGHNAAMSRGDNGRAVVHLHGGLIPNGSDGFPVRLPTDTATFDAGETRTYHYSNDQPATLLWFHDHTMDHTSRNVYAGLAGLYVIRDKREAQAGLPVGGTYELPLLIADRTYSKDGHLLYGGMFDNPDPPAPHAQIPEFKGDVLTVNRAVQPVHEVAPRVYRLRILNGCTGRFVRLALRDGPGTTVDFTVIGTDAGFVADPSHAARTDVLSLAPAERVDVLVDFGAVAGRTVHLINDVPQESSGPDAPCLEGNGGDSTHAGDDRLWRAMTFSVGVQPVGGPSIPSVLAAMSQLGLAAQRSPQFRARVAAARVPGTAPTRRFRLSELGGVGIRVPTAGGSTSERLDWLPASAQPVAEAVAAGAIEIWDIHNDSPDTHPMHIHQCSFEVVSRTPDDPTTDPNWRIPWEVGAPKDVVKVPAGGITRLVVEFGPNRGRAVWHCHITEHEDAGMMRQLFIS